MVEVNWTDDAIKDLIEIGEYIEYDSIKYSVLTVESLFNLTEILENMPKAGRIVPEINKSFIRELISGNYRIVYKIVTEFRVDILTIHHSKRLLLNNPNGFDYL